MTATTGFAHEIYEKHCDEFGTQIGGLAVKINLVFTAEPFHTLIIIILDRFQAKPVQEDDNEKGWYTNQSNGCTRGSHASRRNDAAHLHKGGMTQKSRADRCNVCCDGGGDPGYD